MTLKIEWISRDAIAKDWYAENGFPSHCLNPGGIEICVISRRIASAELRIPYEDAHPILPLPCEEGSAKQDLPLPCEE